MHTCIRTYLEGRRKAIISSLVYSKILYECMHSRSGVKIQTKLEKYLARMYVLSEEKY